MSEPERPAPLATPSPPARVVRLDLEYDGAGFCGWQRQPAGRSVQAVVEEALEHLLGRRTPVLGAGRTDAGVHARGMVASFQTGSLLPSAAIARALDALLPDDVGVLAAADAPPGFHALRDARWKWYRYTVLVARARRVHWRRTAWQVSAPLDVEAMRRAALSLEGRRDFAALQSAGSPRRSTERGVAAVRITVARGGPGPEGEATGPDGPLVRLDVVADGFLYGMVRCMAGTLVEVGRGRRAPESIATLLRSRDRRRAGPHAPAHGLCLEAVGFGGDEPPAFVDPARHLVLESPSSASRTPSATRSP